jgi:mannosyltransferase OCH1-like enzyme
MIPRVLHQTWATRAPPPRLAAWRRTWIATHPGWSHRLHDDAACRALVAARFPEWLARYDALPRAIHRADLFRLLVLLDRGGLYADLDMEAFRPVDDLLVGATCVLSVEATLTRRRQRELGYAAPFQVANCVLAAAPGHPFLAAVLADVAAAGPPAPGDAAVEDWAGPRRLTRVFHALPDAIRAQVRLLPQVHLVAPDLYAPGTPLGAAVRARHRCAGTWRADPRGRGPWRRWVERDRLPWPWPPGR